jgi:hypothetical protein
VFYVYKFFAIATAKVVHKVEKNLKFLCVATKNMKLFSLASVEVYGEEVLFRLEAVG